MWVVARRWIFIVAVVLGALAAFSGMWARGLLSAAERPSDEIEMIDLTAAQSVAEKYLTRWVDGDYQGMWSLLDPRSQELEPVDVFANNMQKFQTSMGRPLSVGEVGPLSYWVDVLLNIEPGASLRPGLASGDITYCAESTVRLTSEKDRWVVDAWREMPAGPSAPEADWLSQAVTWATGESKRWGHLSADPWPGGILLVEDASDLSSATGRILTEDDLENQVYDWFQKWIRADYPAMASMMSSRIAREFPDWKADLERWVEQIYRPRRMVAIRRGQWGVPFRLNIQPTAALQERLSRQKGRWSPGQPFEYRRILWLSQQGNRWRVLSYPALWERTRPRPPHGSEREPDKEAQPEAPGGQE